MNVFGGFRFFCIVIGFPWENALMLRMWVLMIHCLQAVKASSYRFSAARKKQARRDDAVRGRNDAWRRNIEQHRAVVRRKTEERKRRK